MPSSAPPKTHANMIQLIAIGPTVQLPIFIGRNALLSRAIIPVLRIIAYGACASARPDSKRCSNRKRCAIFQPEFRPQCSDLVTQVYYLHPFAGTVTIGPFPLNPMSEIDNRSITTPNMSFDRMSVSEIQNHRPAYRTATDVSVGSVFPLWMFTAGVV